jgi:hypothetical protein
LADFYFPLTRSINMGTVGTLVNNFGENGPAHRRRLRQYRESEVNDPSDGSDYETGDATDALLNRNEIILPIPFASKSGDTCLQQGKGDYILLNLNNALLQGATTVGWGFYISATHVAKLTRISTQHNATFPNVKDSLFGRSKTQFVEYAGKVLRPK